MRDLYNPPDGSPAHSAAFARAGHVCLPPFIFTDPKLYAEFQFVVDLENSLQQHDAIPIAVGSGTAKLFCT